MEKKNKEFVFDAIFSVGLTCRPAYYLQKHELRFYANPLDWMMSYSLDTVIHLYKTKFNDFFVDFVEDKQKTDWFVDIKNNIISMHYDDVGGNNDAFRGKMTKRFERINEKLIKSNKICFISNRNEPVNNFYTFLKEMSAMYSGEITFINIRNNKKIDGIKYKNKKISKKLEFIEYEFNDVHPKGSDENVNPDFWLGNINLWDSIIEKISIK